MKIMQFIVVASLILLGVAVLGISAVFWMWFLTNASLR